MTGIAAGTANFLSIAAQNLLIVPIFLSFWGKERYGIWLSLAAAQAILQTINNAHQGYVGNELNKIIHRHDAKACAESLGSNIVIALALGLVECLVLGVLFSVGKLNSVFSFGAEGEAARGAATTFMILVWTWVMIGPVQGIATKVYAPLGRFSRGLLWGVYIRLGQSIVLALWVWRGSGMPAAALAYGLVGVLLGAWQIGEVIGLLRQAGLLKVKVNLRRGLRDLAKSLVICAKDLIEQCGGNGLILLIGRLLGIALIPMFTTLRTVANTAMQATNILLQPIATDFIRLHVARRGNDIGEAVSMAWFIGGITINLLLALTLPVVPLVYRIWVHGKIEFNVGIYILFLWTVILKNFGAPLVMYLTNNNNFKFMTVASVARNSVAVVGGIVGALTWGIEGIAAALVAAEFLASIWIPLYFTHRELREAEGRMDAAPLFLALAEQVVWALLVAAVLATGTFPKAAVAFVAAMTLAISWQRWKALRPTTRSRVRLLFSPS